MSACPCLKTPAEMTNWSKEAHAAGATIGFVPTMGALHKGHRALIERSAAENSRTVVSIFVNPTQFGADEDFQSYPRTLAADLELIVAAGGEVVFTPDVDAMYPRRPGVWVEVGPLADTMEGMCRPGHFRGVATVVTKLLAIVRPDRAYFGEKDAQQLRIIQALAGDLNLGCEIVPCPTVREEDGLACSSRNRYLTPEERRQAPALYRALSAARASILGGERQALKAMTSIYTILEQEAPEAEVEYASVASWETLEELEEIQGEVLIAAAIRLGKARLIDNVRLSLEPAGEA